MLGWHQKSFIEAKVHSSH